MERVEGVSEKRTGQRLKQQPLRGRRIVVTRAAEQSGELREALESMGAEVLLLPLIRFIEITDAAELDRALAGFAQFDWVIFTSANAAKFAARRADFLKLTPAWRTAELPKIAAVGRATATAAASVGFPADFIATGPGGKELATELAPLIKGVRILLPRSDRAGDELPSALQRAGAKVTEVVAYRTERVNVSGSPILASIAAEEVDAITLASPSAFHALFDLLGVEKLREISRHTALAAIGPTTAAAIRAAGLTVAVEAGEQSAGGLAETVSRHLCERQQQRQRARA